MAITFHQNPKTITPSDNDVLWTFSSNQTAQPNFEFKIELLVDSVVVFIGKVFPIQTNAAYFNAVEILRALVPASIVNSTPASFLNVFNTNTSVRTVALRVTERYGTTIANQATATSSNRTVWKSALSELQWLGFDISDYTVGSGSKLFMTNFPRGYKYWVTREQNNYLMIQGSGGFEVRIQTDSDSELYDFGNSSLLNILNCNIDLWSDETGVSLSPFYEFSINENRSESLRFDVLEPCNESRTVFFLNKLGGVDSWTFTARLQVQRNFERSEFQKKFGSLNGTAYDYDTYEGRYQNFHNKSQSTETIDSDWLQPEVHAWLVRELLESPLVWTEDSEGVKTRWTIQNSTSEEGQDRTELWRQLSLEMKPSLQSYSVTL
jgi:hypothetical protein